MSGQARGIAFAIMAFLIWGFCPLYFKLHGAVPAGEILGHRILWSCLLLLAMLILGRWGYRVKAVLRNPRHLAMLTLSALLVAGNWLLFIWSVNNGHLLDASLGYFINPLLNILLGMLFLGERLRRLQWLALLLALAGSFACYGLIRKQLPVDAQTGLFVETALLLPVALVYLGGFAHSASSNLLANPLTLDLLLMLAGVITTVPLLLFTAGARLIPLSTLGFIQYLGPTIMFLLAIFYYQEAVDPTRLLTFCFIWSALLIFTAEGWLQSLFTTRQALKQN